MLLLATALLYLPSLSVEFVGFDDHEYVKAAGSAGLCHSPVAGGVGSVDIIAQEPVGALCGLAFCHEFLAARPLSATLLLLLALGSKGTAVVFPLWAAELWACGFSALPRRNGAVSLVTFGLLAATPVC